jgi:hypothetical protein
MDALDSGGRRADQVGFEPTMLHAIRIRTRVDSDTLKIPELLKLMGHEIEVIIVDEDPATTPSTLRKPRLGTLRGLVDVPDDFDAPLPDEVLRSFEGDT